MTTLHFDGEPVAPDQSAFIREDVGEVLLVCEYLDCFDECAVTRVELVDEADRRQTSWGFYSRDEDGLAVHIRDYPVDALEDALKALNSLNAPNALGTKG